jgi:multiple sugar transport system permease protein
LLIVKHLGLVNTLPALIVPNLVTPFGIYLLRQFFLTLPVELEEAAMIDGASRFRILRSILLPLMGPPLSTVAVLTFLSVWNDFLWPLVVTSSPNTMTIQLGLATFQSAHFTNWPVLMAATLMSQLPVMLLFLAGQRFFVSSIANTGIK